MRHPWSGLAASRAASGALRRLAREPPRDDVPSFLVLYLTRHLGFSPGGAASMIALYGAVGIAVSLSRGVSPTTGAPSGS